MATSYYLPIDVHDKKLSKGWASLFFFGKILSCYTIVFQGHYVLWWCDVHCVYTVVGAIFFAFSSRIKVAVLHRSWHTRFFLSRSLRINDDAILNRRANLHFVHGPYFYSVYCNNKARLIFSWCQSKKGLVLYKI